MKNLFSKDREDDLKDELAETRKERDWYKDRLDSYKDKFILILVFLCSALILCVVFGIHVD